MKLLLIALGGAIGSTGRYLASAFVNRFTHAHAIPWGTFTVNASGSFIIGLLWAIGEADLISNPLRYFLFIGVLGGYTTFSSFSIETMNLFRSGETGMALGYVLLSNVACIALAFAGFACAKFFLVK